MFNRTVLACHCGDGGGIVPQAVVLFVTTARSGTQWVAHALEATYPRDAVVTHEPIDYNYEPKRFFADDDSAECVAGIPDVARHLEEIAAIDDDRIYIEVGFPVVAAIPAFHARFGDRLRIVQLVRHPMLVASSVVTHGWYNPHLRPLLTDQVELTPFDPHAQLKNYHSRWDAMSRYEKGLYYWTETHLYGLTLEERFPGIPVHRTRFEDLVSGASEDLRALVEFLDLPWTPSILELVDAPVDAFKRRTSYEFDWPAIEGHPTTIEVARRLGYDSHQLALPVLRRRYHSRMAVVGEVTETARLWARGHVSGFAKQLIHRLSGS